MPSSCAAEWGLWLEVLGAGFVLVLLLLFGAGVEGGVALGGAGVGGVVELALFVESAFLTH